jgi:HTH-type transcriptional regulator/antitoxin HigA
MVMDKEGLSPCQPADGSGQGVGHGEWTGETTAVTMQEAWTPQWATHPGEHLGEHIRERGWSHADFACIADMTPQLVSAIVDGSNPVTPATALKLEHALGLKAYVWTGLQANWNLFQARRR